MRYVDRFENIEQIEETAKYYIELLGLQDWQVKFEHTDDLSNGDFAGENESVFSCKCSVIRIRKTVPKLEFRQPQELVLIHELLHCKFIMLENNNYDGILLYEYQHQLLDDMAKAIFNARYGLKNKDYFLGE